MVQSAWKGIWKPLPKAQRKSIRMQRRLFLYWSAMLLVVLSIFVVVLSAAGVFSALMLLVVLSIFVVVLSAAGVFSALDKEIQQIVSVRQKIVVSDLSAQFDKMTAQGIAISEQSSALISDYLFTDPVTSLKVYLILDATANTQAPGAQSSRAGLYLRLANPCSRGAANQDMVLFRGVPDVARKHQLELHNRWKLEFDSSNMPGYEEVLGSPGGRLADNVAWTERTRLTDTWENVMLLMAPIRGNDGSVLGVCGLEVSELYFMLSYPSEESDFGSMVTLLAPMNGDDLLLSRAMAGQLEETYLNTEDVLQVKKGKYFNQYIGKHQTFLGVHTKVNLRMTDGSQLYAVTLVPQDPYLRASALRRAFWIIGTVAILAVLLLLSTCLSRSFAQPISKSLELIRNEGVLCRECSGVTEIDELFDFIGKLQAAGRPQLPSNIEELFASFAQRAAGLTPTEHNILRYYADGKGISEVADQACISVNTVRRHNANIYQKLGVGSREELLLYIELFRRCVGVGSREELLLYIELFRRCDRLDELV